MESLDFAKSCERVDIAYLDPPYNQHPYGSNYFMLNLIASYKKPSQISNSKGVEQKHLQPKSKGKRCLFYALS